MLLSEAVAAQRANQPGCQAAAVAVAWASVDSVRRAVRRTDLWPTVTAEADTPPSGAELFDSPELAALTGWRLVPAACARVVAVEPSDYFDGVYVTVQTDGHPGYDRDISSCVRAPDGQWWENGSVGA